MNRLNDLFVWLSRDPGVWHLASTLARGYALAGAALLVWVVLIAAGVPEQTARLLVGVPVLVVIAGWSFDQQRRDE